MAKFILRCTPEFVKILSCTNTFDSCKFSMSFQNIEPAMSEFIRYITDYFESFDDKVLRELVTHKGSMRHSLTINNVEALKYIDYVEGLTVNLSTDESNSKPKYAYIISNLIDKPFTVDKNDDAIIFQFELDDKTQYMTVRNLIRCSGLVMFEIEC